MGLSATARGLWLDGVAENAQAMRLTTTSALLTGSLPSGSTGIAARPGVRFAVNSPLSVQPGSGMNLTVQAGVAFVQGSTATNSGMYTAVLDANSTITVATSDPTNPRIDNVIVQINDVGSSSSTAVVTLQTGTPAPSPVAPALPANSLLLATVAVAANTSTIVGGNITDQRVYTVAPGGILPIQSLAGSFAGSVGYYAHEISTGRLLTSDGAGHARQPKVGAFAAVSGTGTNPTATNTSTYTNVATATVTVDGATELCVFASWTALTPASGTAVGDFCQLVLTIDGSAFGTVNPTIVRAESTSLNPFGGGNVSDWVTPAAGSHTLALAALSSGHAFSVNTPRIRVAPSLQQ